MNYQKIVNPITNRKVSTHSKLGKQIIDHYLQIGGWFNDIETIDDILDSNNPKQAIINYVKYLETIKQVSNFLNKSLIDKDGYDYGMTPLWYLINPKNEANYRKKIEVIDYLLTLSKLNLNVVQNDKSNTQYNNMHILKVIDRLKVDVLRWHGFNVTEYLSFLEKVWHLIKERVQ